MGRNLFIGRFVGMVVCLNGLFFGLMRWQPTTDNPSACLHIQNQLITIAGETLQTTFVERFASPGINTDLPSVFSLYPRPDSRERQYYLQTAEGTPHRFLETAEAVEILWYRQLWLAYAIYDNSTRARPVSRVGLLDITTLQQHEIAAPEGFFLDGRAPWGWSPQGGWLALYAQHNLTFISTQDFTTHQFQERLRSTEPPFDRLAWSDDERIAIAHSQKQLPGVFQVFYPQRGETRLYKGDNLPPQLWWERTKWFSPGGDYLTVTNSSANRPAVQLIDLSGTAPRVLPVRGRFVMWQNPTTYLYRTPTAALHSYNMETGQDTRLTTSFLGVGNIWQTSEEILFAWQTPGQTATIEVINRETGERRIMLEGLTHFQGFRTIAYSPYVFLMWRVGAQMGAGEGQMFDHLAWFNPEDPRTLTTFNLGAPYSNLWNLDYIEGFTRELNPALVQLRQGQTGFFLNLHSGQIIPEYELGQVDVIPSPDGLYTLIGNEDEGFFTLYAFRHPLTNQFADLNHLSAYSWAWSPDGRWLAALVDTDGGTGLRASILLIETATRRFRMLGTFPEIDLAAFWNQEASRPTPGYLLRWTDCGVF